jgi:hypothetical protein
MIHPRRNVFSDTTRSFFTPWAKERVSRVPGVILSNALHHNRGGVSAIDDVFTDLKSHMALFEL